MATIFIDGFDHYGVTGQNSPAYGTLLQQEWTSAGGVISLSAPLSSTGYSMTLSPSNGGTTVGKTLPASYSRLIGGFRFSHDLRSTMGFLFLDSGTSQSCVTVNTTGTISVRNAFLNGTALSTSTVSVAASTIHYLEFDITFGASASYQVWLDGISVLSGTGNTKTTGNSSSNQIQFTCLAFSSMTYIIDDMYLFDSTGSTCNAVLNTNPRIETQYPSSDTQTQWTNAGNALVPTGIVQTAVSNVTTSTNAPGAGQLVLLKVTPAVNCTLDSVRLLPAASSGSAKFKAVLYSDSAGAPNTLTSGSTTEVTGCTSGTALTLAFNSPQSLTGGTPYWIGYITDTSIALSQYDNATNLGQKKANTYASGAPAGPLSGMTTAQPTWEMWGVCSAATTNWESLATNPAPGIGVTDTTAITSSTVNNEDLYGFPALTTSPATVYAVSVRTNAKLTGTGSRTITVRVKSNTTDSAGSSAALVPYNTYGWFYSNFDTDPNGSIAWTGANVNSATSGIKVTA